MQRKMNSGLTLLAVALLGGPLWGAACTSGEDVVVIEPQSLRPVPDAAAPEAGLSDASVPDASVSDAEPPE